MGVYRGVAGGKDGVGIEGETAEGLERAHVLIARRFSSVLSCSSQLKSNSGL